MGGPQEHQEFEAFDDDHPFVRLFRKPNSFYTSYDLWAFTELFWCLMGEAKWWVMRNAFGVPVEIWVIPTHWAQLYTDGDGKPSYYYVQSPWGHQVSIPFHEVVNIYDHSPLNPLYEGNGITQVVSEWIDCHSAEIRARLAAFKNGGAAAFQILLDDSYGDPDEAMLARFYSKWLTRFQGEDNWGKPLVMPPGAKAEPLGAAMTELPFTASEDQLRDMILCAYGVPKGVVGIEPAQDVSAYAPYYSFLRYTVNPEKKMTGEVVTQKIFQITPGQEQAVLFWEDESLDNPEEIRQELTLRLANAAASPNEVRAKYGLEPWPYGGDDPLLQGAPVPWFSGEEQEMGDAWRQAVGSVKETIRSEGDAQNITDATAEKVIRESLRLTRSSNNLDDAFHRQIYGNKPGKGMNEGSGAAGGYLQPNNDTRSKVSPGRRFFIAIDLHDTLMGPHSKDDFTDGHPLPGAKEALEKFRELGCEIAVCSVFDDVEAISQWMDDNDLPYDWVNENPQGKDGLNSGKIDADLYIDNRGLRFRGDWPETARETERIMAREVEKVCKTWFAPKRKAIALPSPDREGYLRSLLRGSVNGNGNGIH